MNDPTVNLFAKSGEYHLDDVIEDIFSRHWDNECEVIDIDTDTITISVRINGIPQRQPNQRLPESAYEVEFPSDYVNNKHSRLMMRGDIEDLIQRLQLLLAE